MKKLAFILLGLLSFNAFADLVQTSPGTGGGGGGGGTPGGSSGQIQYNNAGSFGGIAEYTLEAFAAHNTIENGLSYDPRDHAYGAICAGYNTFAGDGTTTTFTYTIPFTGTSSTDNTNFKVFYEPTNGSGTATILTSGQFTVTGVNSGSGGTITLASAPPSANRLIVVHDDSAGLVAAANAAVATGGYVSVPKECTIYGSQTLGTQFPEGAQLIGQNFTPSYEFQAQGTQPVMRIIAPTGAAPAYGINISGKNQQFFEGFALTTNVPGFNSLGFLTVPVLMGANTSAGAGGGQSPGIVAQYMTFNSGMVGFGAPIGGISNYIFAVLRFNNFTANSAGVYGPLSDQQIIGNNFSTNGAFGSYGSAGGMIIGPVEGAVGASSAGRIEYNRFEFNSEGIVIQAGALINFDGNQFDANSGCGLDLNTFWSQINVTGGWFRGNGNGGGTFNGNTVAGRDGHICFNGGSGQGSGGLYASNVVFLTNYGEGSTAPIGSPGATTPLYVLDFHTAAADNTNVHMTGGSAQNVAGGNGASITDFAVFRSGFPINYTVDIGGQPVTGKNANGNAPALVRGIPALQFGSVIAYGDHNTLAPNTPPPGSDYGTLISTDMGAGYTNQGVDLTLSCDSLDAGLIYEQAPQNTGNPLYLFLPSNFDPSYGGGGRTDHLVDVSNCYKAALSWVTIPSQFKVIAQDAACVQTGSWTNDPAFGGKVGITSSTNGDSTACTIPTFGGPLYLWYRVHDNDGGTFTYSIDGGTAVSVNTAPNVSPTGDGLGDPFAESVVRIPFVASGSHVITFTVTSATSASNNVYILGVGTSPNLSYQGGGPTAFFASMPYQQNNTNAAISLAYDAAFQADVTQLQEDSLNANFVSVKPYMNFTSDFTSGLDLSVTGEGHVRDAFEGALQFIKNASSVDIVDPRDFGAACNTTPFFNQNTPAVVNNITTTAGSPVISVSNYTFKAGIATQTGGGDVGKVISIFGRRSGCVTCDVGPTTYIASVDTGANTATLGENMLVDTTVSSGVMGGFPSNPADPSTAQDDTVAIRNASIAAAAGGQKTFLPNACLVHNLHLARNTTLEGGMGSTPYSTPASIQVANTQLFIASNGFTEDPHFGIELTPSTLNVHLKDFQISCPEFPYLGYYGITLAGVGAEHNYGLLTEAVKYDHIYSVNCPIGFGVPLGMNLPVVFDASISGTTMTVNDITSTNLATEYPHSGTTFGLDYLAPGRKVQEASFTATFSGTTMNVSAVGSGTIAVGQILLSASASGAPTGTTITALGTGTGNVGTYTVAATATASSGAVTSGTTIVAASAAPIPVGGGAGSYTVTNSHTLALASLTSPPNAVFLSGSMRDSQFYNSGIDLNGDMSDFQDIGSVFTGGFTNCVHIGPNTGGSTGNAANRFTSERFEECNNGALILSATGGDQFTALHFQFSQGCAVETQGTWNDITFTGGTFQGNSSSSTTCPSTAQISLGGTGSGFSVTGAEGLNQNFALGGTSKYFIGSESGSSVDYVYVDSGDVRAGGSTAFTNWATVPTHYRQAVGGEPFVDTTEAKPTITGGACGTSPSVTGTDLSFNITMGSGTLTTCTINFGTARPAAPQACQLTPSNAAAAATGTTGAYVSALSTTQLTVTGTNLTSAAYGINCY